ncbi:hypothetical protein [Pseudomonas sp. OHS18]|uniref:hypothetical protein n=1 Tax=Pseudomonas sp. OHS18 TaxID=3399679 RepID=UPI003A8947A9
MTIFFVFGQVRLDERTCFLWIIIFVLGLLSSFFSQYPEWALYEWSKSAGLFFLILIGGGVFYEKKWLVASLFVTAVLCFFLAYQFALFYLMAFVSGELDLNPYVLYPGFDNPRFYSQALIILLPLVLHVAVLCAEKGRSVISYTIFFVCVIQWSLLIALAGRGSWFAVVLASLVVFIFFKRFRKFFILHFCTVVGGFFYICCCFCLFLGIWGYQMIFLRDCEVACPLVSCSGPKHWEWHSQILCWAWAPCIFLPSGTI